MFESEIAAPDDLTEEPTETVALAEEQTPDVEDVEPVICDPVIGFVCPNKAMTRSAF